MGYYFSNAAKHHEIVKGVEHDAFRVRVVEGDGTAETAGLGGGELAPCLASVVGVPVSGFESHSDGNLVVAGMELDAKDGIVAHLINLFPFLARVGGAKQSARAKASINHQGDFGIFKEIEIWGLVPFFLPDLRLVLGHSSRGQED